jgi:hypothetical protein
VQLPVQLPEQLVLPEVAVLPVQSLPQLMAQPDSQSPEQVAPQVPPQSVSPWSFSHEASMPMLTAAAPARAGSSRAPRRKNSRRVWISFFLLSRFIDIYF